MKPFFIYHSISLRYLAADKSLWIRVAEGKVVVEKLGEGQTAPSIWRAYTDMPSMNGE
jgi:hypothetical protein